MLCKSIFNGLVLLHTCIKMCIICVVILFKYIFNLKYLSMYKNAIVKSNVLRSNNCISK